MENGVLCNRGSWLYACYLVSSGMRTSFHSSKHYNYLTKLEKINAIAFMRNWKKQRNPLPWRAIAY